MVSHPAKAIPVRMATKDLAELQRVKRLLEVKESVSLNLWEKPGSNAARDDLSRQLAQDIAECPDCPEAKSQRYPCGLQPELEQCLQPLCSRHYCRHLYVYHPHSERYLEARLSWYKSLIDAGWITKVETQDTLLNSQGLFPRILHNIWFDLCRTFFAGPFAPIANPMAVTWKSVEIDIDDSASQDKVQALSAVAAESDYRWGTRVLTGTSSENYTACVATILDPGFDLLPQDNGQPQEAQSTIYGWLTDFDALPGKIAKSLRNLCSSKVGGILHPEPSFYPEVKVADNFSLRVHTIETEKNGSGSGSITMSAAYELLKRGAAKLFIHDNLLMLYLVYFAADHSAKGQYVVLPDDEFPTHDPQGNPLPQDVNFLIDSDNFNDRIRIPRYTALAFFPIYEPDFQEVPFYMLEPLHMSENLRKLVSGDRVSRNARQLTSEIARDLPWNIATGDNLAKFKAFYRVDPWHAERNRKAEESAVELFKENPAATAIHAAGGSPWCSPEVMAQLTKLWDSWQGEQKRKHPLPTIPISGHRLWAMYPYYANVPEPPPGYCGLVWSRRNPNQPVGLTGNRRDFQSRTKNALDGYDYDDSVYIMLLEGGNQTYSLYVKREPMSPEGGITPRVTDDDARKLLNNGMLAYEQTGFKDWPDLYDSVNGELIRQPVVVSDPAPDLDRWSFQPDAFLPQVAQMTRFRRYYGGVVNAIYCLYMSGLYDPDQDFGMLSDALDDALGGARNPDSRQQYYLSRILEAIKDGKPVEACIYSRVESKIQALHQERENSLDDPGQRYGKLEVKTFCSEDHDLWRQTTQECIDRLRDASMCLRALANGPISALIRDYSPDTVESAAGILKERNRLWRDYRLQLEDWRSDDSLTPEQIAQLRKDLELEVKAEIDAAFQTAWDHWRQSEDFQQGDAQEGDLMGCYIQLKATRDRRWFPNGEPGSQAAKKRSGKSETPPSMEAPQTRDANRAFPREEREAYFGRQGSLPTALLAINKPEQTPGLNPGARISIGSNSKHMPVILDAEGKPLKVLYGYSSNVHKGLELEVIGYIPTYDCPDVYGLEQHGILVTQVLTAWDGTPFPRTQVWS